MRTAIKITKEAKNAIFDNCKIYGAVENSGKNINFIHSIIGIPKFAREYPIETLIISIISGIIILIIEHVFF